MPANLLDPKMINPVSPYPARIAGATFQSLSADTIRVTNLIALSTTSTLQDVTIETFKVASLTSEKIDVDEIIFPENGTGKITQSVAVAGSVVEGNVLPALNVSGPTIVSTSTDTAIGALRITNRGSGNSIEVEDSANPDSTPFVVDATGNVGIGTTLPNEKLTVIGNISATNNITSTGVVWASGVRSQVGWFGNGKNNDYLLIEPQDDSFRFISNNAERARITSTGSVGIGTTTPNQILTVIGRVSATGGIAIGTQTLPGTVALGNSRTLTIESTNGFTNFLSGFQIFKWTDNNLYVDNYDKDIIVRGFGGARRVTLTDAGNVGIGPIVPNERLTVIGNISSTGAAFLTGLQITNGPVTITGNISGNNLRTSFNQGSATGNYSFAIGRGRAFGDYSFAIGDGSQANGNYSFAGGVAAVAAHPLSWIWRATSDSPAAPASTSKNYQFMVDADGGSAFYGGVGIGTDNNQNALTVAGPISAVTPDKIIGSDDIALTIRQNGDAAALQISQKNASQSFIVDSDGDIGVGTHSPNQKLTVIGVISSTGAMFASGGNSNQWNSTFTTFTNNSASFTTNTATRTLTGLLVTDTEFSNYQTSLAGTTATLLPTSIYRSASSNTPPITVTSNSYTVPSSASSIIYNNSTTTGTLTLPSGASATGRWLYVKTIGAAIINSNTTNIAPLTGTTTNNRIIPQQSNLVAGNWVNLQYDGTNWVVMAAN